MTLHTTFDKNGGMWCFFILFSFANRRYYANI